MDGADGVGGRADGWANGRTSERGLRADERTGGWTGGQASGRADVRTGAGILGGRADEGGRADDGFPKVKLLI